MWNFVSWGIISIRFKSFTFFLSFPERVDARSIASVLSITRDIKYVHWYKRHWEREIEIPNSKGETLLLKEMALLRFVIIQSMLTRFAILDRDIRLYYCHWTRLRFYYAIPFALHAAHVSKNKNYNTQHETGISRITKDPMYFILKKHVRYCVCFICRI